MMVKKPLRPIERTAVFCNCMNEYVLFTIQIWMLQKKKQLQVVPVTAHILNSWLIRKCWLIFFYRSPVSSTGNNLNHKLMLMHMCVYFYTNS